jgi:aspartate/methionine/tyrosine aminotransferase
VIVPSPTYSTHSSAEAANAGQPAVTYRLDPDNHWLPDVVELRNKVKYNPAIAGILLINPDNPTGVVYPENILREIVAIAKEYDLFIVSDEIYHNITYNGESTLPISDLIGDVPAIAMKGISKEFPWPGGRSGWIEVYNADKDPVFAKYVACILNAKLVEVCATTLPQMAISKMMTHPEYSGYLQERKQRYERASNIAYNTLKGVPGLKVNRTNGAFYMAVAFEDGLLNARQTLPIANSEVRSLVEKLVSGPGCSFDKRFVYYLLASTGICTVPLTSFCTSQNGFRITLLERDEAELGRIFQTIAASVTAYLQS